MNSSKVYLIDWYPSVQRRHRRQQSVNFYTTRSDTVADVRGAAGVVKIIRRCDVHPDSPTPEKGRWSTRNCWITSLK